MILIWLGARGLIPARSSRLRPWAGPRRGDPDVALHPGAGAGPRRHRVPSLPQAEVGERTGAPAARGRSEDVDARLGPGKGPSRRVEPVDQGVPAAAVHLAVGT